MVRLLVIAFTFLISSPLLASECGLFRVVKGNVTYKQKDKEGFSKARINKKVCQGDTVKTDADARAKIVMADANELNISPSTELLIEVYNKNASGEKQVLLDVVYGKVRSNVKQKYEDNDKSHYRVKTKSAVAGVRGTEFMASFNAATSESRIVTFEGEVMVGELKGGLFVAQVSVKPGQFTSNKVGTNPHPAKEVPPQELAKMDQDSNVSDSSRNVSGDSAKPEVKKDDSKKEDSKNDVKKEDPKPSKNPESNKDGKSNGDKSDSKAKGPNAATPKVGVSTDRKPASVSDNKTTVPGALPPPELPKDSRGPMILPTVYNPNNLVPTLPTCLTCNDAVVNQKVKVTIVPVLPGGN
jgi:hypothetical protein